MRSKKAVPYIEVVDEEKETSKSSEENSKIFRCVTYFLWFHFLKQVLFFKSLKNYPFSKL